MANEQVLFAKEELADQWMEEAQDTLTDKYLIFLSDGLYFGLNANFVVEIITDAAITPLPMVPEHVRGVMNLRGQIVPIVDVRVLFGKGAAEDNSCTVVLDLGGTQLGVLVDTVDQMVDIPKENILPMPAKNAQKFISGMCTLPDGSGTMMVLDCELLQHA